MSDVCVGGVFFSRGIRKHRSRSGKHEGKRESGERQHRRANSTHRRRFLFPTSCSKPKARRRSLKELASGVSADAIAEIVERDLPELTDEIDAKLEETARVIEGRASLEKLKSFETEWRTLTEESARLERRFDDARPQARRRFEAVKYHRGKMEKNACRIKRVGGNAARIDRSHRGNSRVRRRRAPANRKRTGENRRPAKQSRRTAETRRRRARISQGNARVPGRKTARAGFARDLEPRVLDQSANRRGIYGERFFRRANRARCRISRAAISTASSFIF